MDRALPPAEHGGAAFVLGKIHVGLSFALKLDDKDLRDYLKKLLDETTKDVNQLYYS